MADNKKAKKLPERIKSAVKRRKLNDETQVVSAAVIKRLPRYYRYLRQLLAEDIRRISSGELSRMMNVTASQIRQDFNCFGGFGQQGYGYNVKYLYTKIGELLGVTSNLSAIILGAGNLGSALASSPIFERRGITLKALFDIDPKIVGTTKYGFPVYGVDELEKYIRDNNIDIAIITMPREAAPEMAEKLARYGIRGLWNFTSRELDVTGYGVVTENVHLGDSLMTLCYKISDNNIKD